MPELIYSGSSNYVSIAIYLEPGEDEFEKELLSFIGNNPFQRSIVRDGCSGALRYIVYSLILWGEEGLDFLERLLKLFNERGYRAESIEERIKRAKEEN